MRIGLISDTHGLLRPEALTFLRGADHIIHVTAVRGNNDMGRWARGVPLTADLELAGVAIHVLHDLADLRATARVVVSGHSHRPKVEERDGVLYVNPGSAGPRRFTLPVAAGELRLDGAKVRARIKELL